MKPHYRYCNKCEEWIEVHNGIPFKSPNHLKGLLLNNWLLHELLNHEYTLLNGEYTSYD